ncbi:hypothetical protein LZ578_12345 (plasmid) [Jeotgalibaca sp. MA1X17-3]|uniref:hypothetical protein n=1 Tax=Jeotgalibaca sp. MA1X17-3 TaxID=2908211 RepID=UPI001F4446F0|nr:hypothetical protein [Jeotgalibaca sp. MA1X17-3]UJF16767.1 hypothetical protein LZ578_12345 [Jeotgalibaca sp. MA1X17-3]
MSENISNQDSIEQRSLDFIKNHLNKEDCFGLSDQQFVQLKSWLESAQLNPLSTTFPDIVFNNGFIEHFAITSSSENKKGAQQTRESTIFNKNSENNFLKNLDTSEQYELVSNSYSRPFEPHSHNNVIKSIQKNWSKHIISYEKSMNSSEHRIFLLEYLDSNIHTAITRKNEPAEIFESYRINTDKILLDWIYKYKEKIDYLILINPVSFSLEVIKIDSIPKILEKEIEVIYAPISGFESHGYHGVKLPGKDI